MTSKPPKDHCLTDLRLRILGLEIAPGSDLEEAGLCAQYGLSRTPLREVLQRLAGEGYLTLHQNRGAKVASMDLARMRMFFQTAPLVYCTIARLAAEHRNDRQLADLRRVQDAFADAARSQDPARTALQNHRFHEGIGEMAHNPYMVVSLNRMLIDHTRLSQTFFRPASPPDQARIAQAVDQHAAMIEAIARRDAQAAVDLTLEHWDLSRDQMERFVRPDPLPLDLTLAQDTQHAV